MRIGKFILLVLLTSVMLCGIAATPVNPIKVGQVAPNFTLTGADGKQYTLNQYRGKIVVLEWFSRDCPFVAKQYTAHKMQTLQKTYTQKGVIWFSIISSAPGKDGYETGSKAQDTMQSLAGEPTAILLDPTGEVGHLYNAKTTPDMYIISKNGTLVYMGAIDNKPSTNPADVKNAVNYVEQALNELLAGKSVSVPETVSYGCTVKYKNGE